MKQLILLVSLVFVLTSCVTYKDVEFVSFDTISIENLSFTGVDVGVTVTIKNPNNYKIKIVDSDIDLFIGDNNLGKIVVPEKLVFDRKVEKQQTFVVETGLSKISKSAIFSLMAILNKEGVRVKAKGTFKAKAFAVGKTFLIDFEDDVKMEGKL